MFNSFPPYWSWGRLVKRAKINELNKATTKNPIATMNDFNDEFIAKTAKNTIKTLLNKLVFI